MDHRKWLRAIYRLAATKETLSRAELAGQLGLARQTAGTMRHKIMQAMARREDELVLLGLIEIDESYVGGKRQGKRGRGAERSLLPE